MANSAVVSLNAGFDVGSENCYVAVTRGGGIEIVLNDYSQRSTPAYVALGDRQRELGVSAKQKQLMNLQSTFYALTRLIGRQFEDVMHTENLPFPIEAGERGDVVISVTHNQQDFKFTAVQLLAMLLTKLRQIGENVTDCVINCPGYFTDAQRRALLDAARLAGLQPLRILPDLTAVGLYYGFYRAHSLPAVNVAFVGCGHTTTQVAVVRFQTGPTGIGSMTVLSAEADSCLGGANFDEVLAQHFLAESKLTVKERGWLRLLAACEKVKKQMSANSNVLPVNVECLQDDRDYTWSIDRAKFEELAAPLLQRVELMFRKALEKAHEKFLFLQKDDKIEFKIDAVEIVGGSSRVASIKRLAKEVFGQEPTSTLNADEAVARGCSLMCAMLSPTVKVKEFHVVDFAPYPISCKYWFEKEGDPKVFEIKELFPRGHPYPFTKKITASCSSLPMVVELEYRSEKGHVNGMCQFRISALEPLTLHKNKLTLLVRLDSSGLVSVTSASIAIENLSNGTTENGSVPMDTDPAHVPSPGAAQSEKTEKNGEESKMEVDGPADGPLPAPVPEKPKFLSVPLGIEAVWIRGTLTADELMLQREIEVSFVEADRDWKERQDARNQLEEYVYEWKGKVTDCKEHVNFRKSLEDMQTWLYETEDLLSKRIYIEKLQDLDIECKILFPPPPPPPPPVEPEPAAPVDATATPADDQHPADPASGAAGQAKATNEAEEAPAKAK